MNTESIGVIQTVVKIGLLIFFGIYVVVAITAYHQMSKLEVWLISLKRYPFNKIARIHLIMAIAGWILALLIFII